LIMAIMTMLGMSFVESGYEKAKWIPEGLDEEFLKKIPDVPIGATLIFEQHKNSDGTRFLKAKAWKPTQPLGDEIRKKLEKNESILPLYSLGKAVPISFESPVDPAQPFVTNTEDLKARANKWTSSTGAWRSICESSDVTDDVNQFTGFSLFVGTMGGIFLSLYACFRLARRRNFQNYAPEAATGLDQQLMHEEEHHAADVHVIQTHE